MNWSAETLRQTFRRHLLGLLILAYGLGAVFPEAGLWIRGSQEMGHASGWMLKTMLALLLVNVGLRVDVSQLSRLARRGPTLVTALVTTPLASGGYVLGLTLVIRRCDPAGTFDQMSFGLAVVAAMPVAASSTAWAQNSEGDLALSLGLLLASTLFSPLTAVLILCAAGRATGTVLEPAAIPLMTRLATAFLTCWVILPIFSGIGLRAILGGRRVNRFKPQAGLLNLAILLVLNYANASLALPTVIAAPEPIRLVVVAASCLGLAATCFAAAALVSRLHAAGGAERASLLFAMGMKNNGAGLVLVATVLAAAPQVMLPVIVYNLTQHLAAAALDRFALGFRRARS